MFDLCRWGMFTEIVSQCSTFIVFDLCYTMEIGLELSILYNFSPCQGILREKQPYEIHRYCPLPRAISFSSASFADPDSIFRDFEVPGEALRGSCPEAPPCLLVFEVDFFLACSGPGCSNSRLRGLTPWDSGCSAAGSPFPFPYP